ncbi:MAG: Mrp/NBP35 family ATP-binding protein [Treponema sp.]|nr:Mrp/NBP35 family ATP-binding protein [Treponema sp.]
MAEDNISSENCNHKCDGCGKDGCPSRSGGAQKDMHERLHEGSRVKKVIGIVSGKGGVGKSLVTSLIASKVQKDGFRTAILDADITGPSIPTAFGLGQERAEAGTMTTSDGNASEFIKPVCSAGGVQIMSMNFLLQNETDPVIWRGPVISGAVRQFWTDVVWDDVDFMFVDCPPGTGDVPLTLFQSLPVDGIIVVASPQQLVRVIVEKAVNMANMMGIPVLGLIENMSYVRCPDCGKEIRIFGESNIGGIAQDFGLPVLARIPIEQNMSVTVDNGEIESLDVDYVNDAADAVESLIKKI